MWTRNNSRMGIFAINAFQCRTHFDHFKNVPSFVSRFIFESNFGFGTVSNACQLNIHINLSTCVHSIKVSLPLTQAHYCGVYTEVDFFPLFAFVVAAEHQQRHEIYWNLCLFRMRNWANFRRCVRFLKMNDTVIAIRFMSMPSTSTKVDSKRIPHLMCTQSIETRWKRYIFNLQQLTLDHMLAFIWRWSWHWRWLLVIFFLSSSSFIRWFRFRFRFCCFFVC